MDINSSNLHKDSMSWSQGLETDPGSHKYAAELGFEPRQCGPKDRPFGHYAVREPQTGVHQKVLPVVKAKLWLPHTLAQDMRRVRGHYPRGERGYHHIHCPTSFSGGGQNEGKASSEVHQHWRVGDSRVTGSQEQRKRSQGCLCCSASQRIIKYRGDSLT